VVITSVTIDGKQGTDFNIEAETKPPAVARQLSRTNS